MSSHKHAHFWQPQNVAAKPTNQKKNLERAQTGHEIVLHITASKQT